MIYLLMFTSILTSILSIFTDNKNRIFKYISLTICFIFMWILLGWSYGAYDIMVGINRYNNYELYSSFTEIGYTWIISLAHKINMGYRDFFVICSFFELLVLFWFVIKNSKNPLMVFLLFTIYPLVIFFQYTRNIAAFSLVLIGIDALINKEKHWVIKYFIFIILGSLIHIDSLFFILFLIVPKLNQKSFYLILIFIFILLLIPITSTYFNDFINNFLGQQKVDIINKVDSAEGQFGRVFGICFAILEFYIMDLYLYKICNEKSDNRKLFYRMNFIMLLLVPLTLNYGVGFARIVTLISIVNYTYYVNCLENVKTSGLKYGGYFILLFFLLSLLFICFRNEEYRKLVLYPFFEQNEFLR